MYSTSSRPCRKSSHRTDVTAPEELQQLARAVILAVSRPVRSARCPRGPRSPSWGALLQRQHQTVIITVNVRVLGRSRRHNSEQVDKCDTPSSLRASARATAQAPLPIHVPICCLRVDLRPSFASTMVRYVRTTHARSVCTYVALHRCMQRRTGAAAGRTTSICTRARVRRYHTGE